MVMGLIIGSSALFLQVGGMFEDAGKYAELASDHVNEARYILDKYGGQIRGGDGESVLDVGCGSGNVSFEALGKFRKWRHVHGIDFNEKMVNFATKSSPNSSQFSFELVDFNAPVSGTLADTQFDKIFSFFAIQWMNNRENVAKNIHTLLKPGGQAFLLIVSHSKIYEVWDDMVKDPKWKKYIPVQKPLNELVYSDNPGEMLVKPLKKVGMKIVKNEVVTRKNVFKALDDSDAGRIEKLKSVDPFLNSIPEDERQEYLNDLLAKVKRDIGPHGATDYNALVIIAEKP